MDYRSNTDTGIATTPRGILAALMNHYGRNMQAAPVDHSADAELARLLALKGAPQEQQAPTQGIGLGTGDPGLRRPYDYRQQAQSQQGWMPL